MLAEGGDLDDPATFVRRINRLIVEGLAARPNAAQPNAAQSKIVLS
jgi:hypothetical protein